MQSKPMRLTPTIIVLLTDGLLIFFGFITAVFIRDRILDIVAIPWRYVLAHVGIQLFIATIIWTRFRFHKRVIRLFHARDYLQLILAVLLLHGARLVLWYVFPADFRMPRSLWPISFFTTVFFLVASRIFVSYMYQYYMQSNKAIYKRRLLIFGAGELGFTLKRSIDAGKQFEYRVMGFIDDDSNKIGKIVQGCEVYDAGRDIRKTIVRLGITDIIIATKSLPPERKARFLNDTIIFNIRIRELPALQRWFDSHFNLNTIQRVDINDLLNRAPINLYSDEVHAQLGDKTILVTGAAGSIGSELVRKLALHGAQRIICLDSAETPLYDLEQAFRYSAAPEKFDYVLADVRQERKMRWVFETFKPDYVFHAAAYKHVPILERYPMEGLQTNVLGTLNTARLAAKAGVRKFVLVSTDKAIKPTSIMGAGKRIAEMSVQCLQEQFPETEFSITRFGNVLDSNGSVVPLFRKQIEKGGPLTITHPDMVRYFMTIGEAAQLIIEAGLMARGGEVFIFDMGEPVKIKDLAVNMIRLSGFIPEVDIPITYIGMRPGEKLYENLFADQEQVQQTHHAKIMIGKVRHCDTQKLKEFIDAISGDRPLPDTPSIRTWIKQIVPEYLGVREEVVEG